MTRTHGRGSPLRLLPQASDIVQIPGHSGDIAHVQINFADSEGAAWYAYGKYDCDGLAHALYLSHKELDLGDGS